MIYILSGSDTKKRNLFLNNLLAKRESIRFQSNQITKEIILEYSRSINLFGISPVLIIDNLLADNSISFLLKDLASLQESNTTFVFIEDKLKISDEKRYTKYAKIEHFDEKKVNKIQKFNTFAIADSYARRDKIGTWVLYSQAIEHGVESESISGILFWKIKSMLLAGSRVFDVDELRNQSSSLVTLYHMAHRGEVDFAIGLEQFILSSLTPITK